MGGILRFSWKTFFKCKKSILPLFPKSRTLICLSSLHDAATQEKKASSATTASRFPLGSITPFSSCTWSNFACNIHLQLPSREYLSKLFSNLLGPGSTVSKSTKGNRCYKRHPQPLC